MATITTHRRALSVVRISVALWIIASVVSIAAIFGVLSIFAVLIRFDTIRQIAGI